MRILIVGLGSMGRRHLANLRILEPGASIAAWRLTNPANTDASTGHLEFSTWEQVATWRPEIGFITCPASLHVELALKLADLNAHLFVEKPLSYSLDGVARLLDVCRRKSLVLMVGYNLRFACGLQLVAQSIREGRIGRPLNLQATVGQYLPDWRAGADYRESVSAKRRLGGGVLLELSHELDYARWLLGEVESVSAQIATVGDLEIDVEDAAEITLRFVNGATGHVHLDMLQRSPERRCRIAGTQGTVEWNGRTDHARLFEVTRGDWTELSPAKEFDRNQMYVAELEHFLGCVRSDEQPVPDGADGLETLRLVLAARQSAHSRSLVAL